MYKRVTARARSGFTLIELIVVVAIIAIIVAMGLPKLLAARLAANESSAIATMRALASAEVLIQGQSVIDSDGDGSGEMGYFAELAGTAPVRTSAGGVPAVGATPLNPVALSHAFGVVNSNGLVAHSGYYFQIWLPNAPAGGVTSGISELANVGGADPAALPDSDQCEITWCCYAWPIAANTTGNRAFFVCQQGDLLQFDNRSATPYTNIAKMPAFDEAFTTLGDMSSPPRINLVGGHDATRWVPVQ
jgi:prepilin-type N-terminal cleavage/methylation domain-containing protein